VQSAVVVFLALVVGAPVHHTKRTGGAHEGGKKVARLEPTPRFQRIGLDAGLPQLSIYSMAEDPAGFMWFGTGDGLARYDGYKFRVFQFDPAAKTSISNNSVTALFDDGKGTLWIGTNEGGLNKFDHATETFTAFRADPKDPRSLSNDGVTSIFRDKAGAMWIGTLGGLSKLDASGGKFMRFKSDAEDPRTLPADPVLSICEGAAGLWVGTTGGLALYDATTGAFTRYKHKPDDPTSLSDHEVNAVYEDKSGVLWVGTDGGGLNAFDARAKKFIHYRHDPDDPESLSDDRVRVIFEDKTGSLWIGTRGQLNQLNKKTGRFKRFVSEQNDQSTLPNPWVASLFEDTGGVLWVGTWGGGAGKLDLQGARIPLYKSGSVFSFYDEGNGTVWIGEQVGGLLRFDRKTGSVKNYRAEAQETVSIHAIHKDKSGALWLGTAGKGLRRFDPVTEQFQTFEPSDKESGRINSDTVFSIYEDEAGIMWLGTFGGGLDKFDPKANWFAAYASDPYDRESLSSAYIYTVVPSKNEKNVLWIGTANGGLNRFDKETEAFTHYANEPNNPDSLSNNNVISIYEDDDGVFWLGTYGGGLNRFDSKKNVFKHYTTKDGLPQNFVFGILPDEEGHLWLSTNKGLSKFDKKTEIFTNFDVNDGLQGSEFSQGAYHKGRSGELFFGGVNGFNAFSPKDLKLDPFVPPIAITSFQIANKEYDLGAPLTTIDRIDLKYSQSLISFEFAALSFAAPEKNRYQYRLDGLHDWVDTDRRFVTYSNLAAGDYVFRVKGSNRHHVWNEEGIAVRLHIAPAPWRTWWAYSLYGLVVLGLIVLYVRWQEARVERLRQAARLKTVEKDLDVASTVQSWFLPAKPRLDDPRCGLAGFYRAADRASGDWWWYERLDEETLWVIVGDVTGHGAGPALVTAAVATALRVQTALPNGDARSPMKIQDRLVGVNDQVRSICAGKYFMTTTSLEIDEAGGRVIFYGTGGLPAFCLKKEGRATTVGAPGTPLGAHPFEVGRVDYAMTPGERMMIYTDGITEALMPDGKMIGARRAREIFESTRNMPLQAATQAIITAVDKARGTMPQEDDFTFVLIDWAREG
jgi:ligand-binding sensor domain-containing protein/serine phosphatase RsbU (regulator of sigma subunit)